MHGMSRVECVVNKAIRFSFLCLLLCSVAQRVQAQVTIRGMVVEDESDLPVMGATIQLVESNLRTVSDRSGWFMLQVPLPQDTASYHEWTLRITAMGYEDSEVIWRRSSEEVVPLDIRLKPSSQRIEEIHILQKGRYSNRDNPAVELIAKVRAHRAQNRIQSQDFLRYRAYNKIMMAVAELPQEVAQMPLFRKYGFIFENVDTLSSPGRKLLPLYLEEKLSQEYRQGRPLRTRSVLEAKKRTELDERFVNNENIQAMVDFLHADMDLYANNLILFNRTFMTPVATGSHLFYKFAIRDTITLENQAYIRVDFLPRNEQDRLFSGNLLISTDGQYAVREAFLHISSQANINWINNLEVHYEFEKQASGAYFPHRVVSKVNFGIFGSKQGLYSHWTQHFDDYSVEPIPAEIWVQKPVSVEPHHDARSERYWQNQRPVTLSSTEYRLYRNIDSLRDNPSFINTLEWLNFIATSYKRVGPVELGPLENVYSFNSLEGSRVRVGGRISRAVSDRVFAEGYTAYGFKDQRFKYYGLLAINLNRRNIAEFPAHFLNVSYHQDVREPGRALDVLNGDDFFRSFRRNKQDRWFYHRLYKLQHSIEFGNHWSVRTTLTNHEQRTAGDLIFRRVKDDAILPEIQTTEAMFEVRWAPYEEFFQRNIRRSPIPNEYPVLNFSYKVGLDGVLGGEYAYHALRFDVLKRFYLSIFGISELRFGTGYIFGTLPFPLLEIPMADQSYLVSPDSYSLMNNLEFVSDHFAKLSVDHRFQGLFINKIPWLRKTKIRETIGAKVYFGRLRQENNPLHNPELFYFPVNEDGQQATYAFRRTPYVEARIGLENIFNFLRIEYIKRLSYLDLPDVREDGLRFSVRLGF